MEDILKALLDVVRAQHAATEGTEEAPFDMDDVVDMAMNLVGRPDEPEEVTKMVESIQSMVETMAPDLFPPKTFEQMDDEERALSAGNMIEARLKRGRTGATGRPSGSGSANTGNRNTEAGNSDKTDVKRADSDHADTRETDSDRKATDSSRIDSDKAGTDSGRTDSDRKATDSSRADSDKGKTDGSRTDSDSKEVDSNGDGADRTDASSMDSGNRNVSTTEFDTRDSNKTDNGQAGVTVSSDATQVNQDIVAQAVAAASAENGFNAQETAQLNDLIYKSLAGIMGVQDPQVEYPFDRSQIRYGREKTITEMLEQEQAEKKRENDRQMEYLHGEREAELRQEDMPQAEESLKEEQTAGKPSKPQSAMDLAQSAIDRNAASGANKGQKTAWELAQDVIDQDVAAHEKEPYVPPVVEVPETKSASQLAAEAIRKAQEQDREKLEIEKQAERLMEEAKKRGQDPMKFALHQQEILQYMEKNSDELVSFEDYEDLSPEEKYEIERQIYVEKQIANGVDPEKVDHQVPEEYIPEELKKKSSSENTSAKDSQETAADSNQSGNTAGQAVPPVLTEEMLRQLSAEVLQENSDMILAENENEDMESLNNLIFENIKQMMSGSGTEVKQEDVGDLLEQAAQSAKGQSASNQLAKEQPEGRSSQVPAQSSSAQSSDQPKVVSAVDLAKAAQKAAKPEPKPASDPVSTLEPKPASDLASKTEPKPASDLVSKTESKASSTLVSGLKTEEESISERKPGEVAESASKQKPDMTTESVSEPKPDMESDTALDLNLTDLSGEIDPENALKQLKKVVMAGESKEEDILGSVTEELEEGFDFDEIESEENIWGEDISSSETVQIPDDAITAGSVEGMTDSETASSRDQDREERTVTSGEETKKSQETPDQDVRAKQDNNGADSQNVINSLPETDSDEDAEMLKDEEQEEYLYVDPDERVLGEHTQAEVDEALENLDTLGLEGDVYERAKYMLLLEMAGSEEELAVWQKEQENGRKKKAAVSALDETADFDLADLDEDSLEKEMEQAMDEDFAGEDSEKDSEKELRMAIDEDFPDNNLNEVPNKLSVDDEVNDAEDDSVILSDAIQEDSVGDDISEIEVEDKDSEVSFSKKRNDSRKAVKHSSGRKKVVRKKEKKVTEASQNMVGQDLENAGDIHAEEKGYQVSLKNPFVLKNSASYMNQFEEYITDTQENRKLSTGFRKLDAILRFGLHKGSYFIDSEPQYLKNSFMQQLADQAAQGGVDVLYISTELSRYDLMVDTVSRLSYEMHPGDPTKAVSVMAIMTGEDGADLASLKDELNWYRGRISEHLYILDQEAVTEYTESMEEASAGDILEGLIRSIVREGAHKPVVFIDNIENILSVEDSEDMRPLMEGIRKLSKELGIPIIMSYGYAQAENETELDPAEQEFHESLGNMCDVYMELSYAPMITEDSVELTEGDIREMVEDGETLLIDVMLHRNRRPMRASCQIQGTPKYNYFEE